MEQPLDRRIHQKYDGWKCLLPTHVKVQYAGGMGFMSFGAGWDYGRKCRWETDVMIGLLPKAYSNRTHATFTFKQNYIPWSIGCNDRFAIEPFACGIYLNLISGEDYWIRKPDRYPDARYYWFASRLRTFFYVGQRFTYYPKSNELLRHITLFYEFSVNDLDMISAFGNHSLKVSDIASFSVGIKFQLFR